MPESAPPPPPAPNPVCFHTGISLQDWQEETHGIASQILADDVGLGVNDLSELAGMGTVAWLCRQFLMCHA